MIFVESNIPSFIGYNITDTSKYTSDINIKDCSSKFYEILILIDHLVNNNLVDNGKYNLYPSEVIHLMNIVHISSDNFLFVMSPSDIDKKVAIVDNIPVKNFRVICTGSVIPKSRGFSLLVRDELRFDANQHVYTIFVDETFLNGKDKKADNENLSWLIFDLVDWVVTHTMKMNYNTFSEHPGYILDEEDDSLYHHIYDYGFTPYTIFRNNLSTIDMLYIADYIVTMVISLVKFFKFDYEDLYSHFSGFGIFDKNTWENVLKPIWNKVDSTNVAGEEYLKEEVIKEIFTTELEVVEAIVKSNLDKIYDEE